MRTNLKQFNFRIPIELKDKIDAKSDATRIGASAIVTLAFQKWVDGLWNPERDVDSGYTSQILVHVDADLLAAVMLKRRETGTNVSAVAREALRLWAEDEWSVSFHEAR